MLTQCRIGEAGGDTVPVPRLVPEAEPRWPLGAASTLLGGPMGSSSLCLFDRFSMPDGTLGSLDPVGGRPFVEQDLSDLPGEPPLLPS